jgi:hypothetical protein
MINFALGAVAMAFVAVMFPTVPQTIVDKLKELRDRFVTYLDR